MRTKEDRPRRRGGMRSLSVAIVVAVAALLLGGSAAPLPVVLTHVAGVTPDNGLDRLWQAYGDKGGHWTGADSTTSVPLPDGRIAWLFSDTFLGPVNAAHCRPRTSPFIRNSIVVQDGSELTTRVGGTRKAPRSVLEPGSTASAPSPEGWYWVADGTVEGDTLRVFYNRYRTTGTGPLDYGPAGTVAATFSLPDLDLLGTDTVPGTGRVLWGSAVVEDGGYTYVYGSEASGGSRFAHLARAGAGRLAEPWQYWTGAGWSPTESHSTRLLSGVGTAFSVDRVGGRYVLVTQESNAVFSPHIVAYFAARPTGPFTEPTYLYQAPEARGDQIVYDARLHPELSTSSRLVISYNVNTLKPDEPYRDSRIYRPRFIDVALRPGAPPRRAGLPPAPANLSVTSGDGSAQLSWDPQTGNVSYQVYQRDTTAGQTGFGRLAPPAPGTHTLEAGSLRPGHEYEYRVTTVNDAGEGTPSRTVRTIATARAPHAPTGLRATARPDGQVDLAWTAAPDGGRAWYTVAQRDLTAGAASFTPRSLPVMYGTTATADHLVYGHRYEFQISAVNLAGESTSLETAQVVAVRQPGVLSSDDDPCPSASGG